MVRISDGKNELIVPNGAFKTIYKGMGFKIVGKMKSAKKEEGEEENSSASDNDDDFIEQLMEKPISEWTREEVKRFAEIKGIDISETKKVTEAKSLIRNFLELSESK